MLIQASGYDRGQFGTASTDELRGDVYRFAPIELFIDASDTTGAQMPVQEQWTEWRLRDDRAALKSVNILVAGKYMHLTMVAKLFSRTGELIRVYLDAAAFDEALERAAPGASKLRGRASR